MDFLFLIASSPGTKMEKSSMDTPVIRVKGHQWRTSMKQGYQKLMVRWLHFLVFMMVFSSLDLLYVPSMHVMEKCILFGI